MKQEPTTSRQSPTVPVRVSRDTGKAVNELAQQFNLTQPLVIAAAVTEASKRWKRRKMIPIRATSAA